LKALLFCALLAVSLLVLAVALRPGDEGDPRPALPVHAAPAKEPRRKSASPVQVTEVHYHPPAERPRTEFIEIRNGGGSPADLSGWKLTSGAAFTFPAGFELAPGEIAIIAGDVAAFREAFGDDPRVAGAFEGRLDDSGEELRLCDGGGASVSDFRWLDGPPWPAGADGGGMSLERVRLDGDPDDPASWEAGGPSPGSPARAREGPIPAGAYQLRLAPRMPGPADEVTASARIRSHRPGVKATLHYTARGAERTIEMGPSGGPAGPDPVFESKLPRHRPGTLIRWWISVDDGQGRISRSPPLDAKVPTESFIVEPALAGSTLPVRHVVIAPRDLEALMSNRWSNDTVGAVVSVNGRVHEGARIRPRGAWARSWPKPSFKVIAPEGRPFSRGRRLNWNSCWHDPSFIREKLAYEIFRMGGAPSLEARMVRVHVNGEFFGVYVEVEQPKSRTLERLGTPGAVLYKAMSQANIADERDLGSAEAYEGHYEIETAKETGFEPLWSFCRGLAAARDKREFFEKNVDLDRYVAYLAATAFTQNWDGFNKNHFIAWDANGTGKWSALPWDLDRTLGDHWSWSFESSNLPVHMGSRRSPGATGWNRLADAFFSDPSLEKLFFDALGKRLASAWTEEKIDALVNESVATIGEAGDVDRARWGGESDWRAAALQLKRYARERRAFLVAALPVGLPARPRNRAPAAGAAVSSSAAVLETAPFAHEDGSVTHAATHWQVRASRTSWATPVIDLRSRADLTHIEVPRGSLLPRETYAWRAAHVASSGKTSEWSEETTFAMGDFELRVAPFDLEPLFNTDLVANPGDRTNDSVDARAGVYIVEGFDGARSDNRLAEGLPRDRKVGIHGLGSYDGPNALTITARTRKRIRIDAPPGRYAFVRFLVAGGTGDSSLPVGLEYAEGPAGAGTIPCDDWYDDGPPEGSPGDLQPGSAPILNGMDRMRGSQWKDRNEPAIFEVTVKADPERTLRAIVIDPSRGTFATPQTSFHLFAATGVEVR